MSKLTKKSIEAGSKKQTHEPRLLSEVLEGFFQSDSSLAQVCRNGLFGGLYPHTEPCCQLKLLTRKPGRMPEGTCLVGTISHDGENHFTFMEEAPERKGRKNSRCVFKGYTINVHNKDDGTLFPTFRQPHYTRFYTFRDFCREAAEELLLVVSLLEDDK